MTRFRQGTPADSWPSFVVFHTILATIMASVPTRLAVDDEEFVRDFIVDARKTQCYEMLSASNVMEAKQVASGAAVDILVTDRRLLDESGVELVRHIYQAGSSTAIIVVTACPDQDKVDSYRGTGGVRLPHEAILGAADTVLGAGSRHLVRDAGLDTVRGFLAKGVNPLALEFH